MEVKTDSTDNIRAEESALGSGAANASENPLQSGRAAASKSQGSRSQAENTEYAETALFGEYDDGSEETDGSSFIPAPRPVRPAAETEIYSPNMQQTGSESVRIAEDSRILPETVRVTEAGADAPDSETVQIMENEYADGSYDVREGIPGDLNAAAAVEEDAVPGIEDPETVALAERLTGGGAESAAPSLIPAKQFSGVYNATNPNSERRSTAAEAAVSDAAVSGAAKDPVTDAFRALEEAELSPSSMQAAEAPAAGVRAAYTDAPPTALSSAKTTQTSRQLAHTQTVEDDYRYTRILKKYGINPETLDAERLKKILSEGYMINSAGKRLMLNSPASKELKDALKQRQKAQLAQARSGIVKLGERATKAPDGAKEEAIEEGFKEVTEPFEKAKAIFKKAEGFLATDKEYVDGRAVPTEQKASVGSAEATDVEKKTGRWEAVPNRKGSGTAKATDDPAAKKTLRGPDGGEADLKGGNSRKAKAYEKRRAMQAQVEKRKKEREAAENMKKALRKKKKAKSAAKIISGLGSLISAPMLIIIIVLILIISLPLAIFGVLATSGRRVQSEAAEYEYVPGQVAIDRLRDSVIPEHLAALEEEQNRILRERIEAERAAMEESAKAICEELGLEYVQPEYAPIPTFTAELNTNFYGAPTDDYSEIRGISTEDWINIERASGKREYCMLSDGTCRMYNLADTYKALLSMSNGKFCVSDADDFDEDQMTEYTSRLCSYCDTLMQRLLNSADVQVDTSSYIITVTLTETGLTDIMKMDSSFTWRDSEDAFEVARLDYEFDNAFWLDTLNINFYSNVTLDANRSTLTGSSARNTVKTAMTPAEIGEILMDSGCIRGTAAYTALEYALSKVGCTYSLNAHWATDGDGSVFENIYDCSSLAYRAYIRAGIDLTSRTTGQYSAAEECREMIESGKAIICPSNDYLQPGDLIFYADETCANGRYLGVWHVSLYVGNGKVVEASTSENAVVYREFWKSSAQAIVVARPILQP